MNEVVICDTNAAIHLAIICPEVLKSPSPKCNIVLHPIVKQEIQSLMLDTDKKKRLGSVLELISKEITANTKVGLPPKDKEIQLHKRIKIIENALDPTIMSSGSSHEDRCFLIIAKVNAAKLLTNERTLYHLGENVLGPDNVWRTSNALEELLSQAVLTKDLIQSGLLKLNDFEENLHHDCMEKLTNLGFKF